MSNFRLSLNSREKFNDHLQKDEINFARTGWVLMAHHKSLSLLAACRQHFNSQIEIHGHKLKIIRHENNFVRRILGFDGRPQ